MKKRNIALVGVLASTALYGAALKYYYDFCFKRNKEQDEPLRKDGSQYLINEEGMKMIEQTGYQEVHIESRDGLQLTGYYFDQHSKNTIILVHGYRSTGFNEYASYIQFFLDASYNVLIIDHRSHGKSEGKWIDFGYNERYDLLEWSSFIQKNYPCDNLYYLGVSMGSATVMLASNEKLSDYHVRAIIADCGYDTLENEVKSVMKGMHVPAFLFYQPSNIIHKIHTGHSIEETAPIESVKNATVPILFIHGTNDDFVPTRMVFPLYEACPTQKELLLVEDATHARNHYYEPEHYEKKVLSFMKKYQQ